MSFMSLWDDKKNPLAPNTPPTTQPGAPITTAAPGTTAGQASKGETKGTSAGSGWTNLQQYVGANQGAGDAMGAKIGQDFSGVNKTANDTLNTFNTDASKSITDGTHIGAGNIDFQNNFDPTKIDQGAFNAWKTSTYDGPSSVATGAGVQGQQDILGQWANNAGGGGQGRKNLLAESYKRPDYNSGMQNLDSQLLGGSASGMGQMQGIQDSARDYTTRVGDTTAALNTQAAGAGQQVNQTNKNRAADINNAALDAGYVADSAQNRSNTNAILSATTDTPYDIGLHDANQAAQAKKKALDDLINGRR